MRGSTYYGELDCLLPLLADICAYIFLVELELNTPGMSDMSDGFISVNLLPSDRFLRYVQTVEQEFPHILPWWRPWQ